MSQSTLTITPYLRSNYVGENGKSSIMIRIILNGERVQFSSKLEIEVDKWDAMQGKIVGWTTKLFRQIKFGSPLSLSNAKKRGYQLITSL